MSRKWIFVAAALCVAVGAIWYWRRGAAQASSTASEEHSASTELPTVSVVAASREDLTKAITLTAEFVPFQEVDVMAKVAGYVQKINVDVGDVVRQGQVLAVLESPEMRDDLARAGVSIQRNKSDYQRASDEVKRAESNYAMTHLTYTRLANVMKSQPGLVAQQEVDDAQAKDQIAASQLAAARSSVETADQQIKVSEADQTKSRTMLDYTNVVAPFDGVVTKRYADNGSMIQAGTSSRSQASPVVRISENQLLRLVLPVPESAAGSVKPGRSVDVKVPSLNTVLSARVSRIADKVDTSTRTMHVEVDIPNANGKLIPGMYAEVTVKLAESPNAVAVPTAAVRTTPSGKQEITVVDSNGAVEIRRVRTGLESALEVEILDGLKEGELVVVGSHSQLIPGSKVKAKIEHAEGSK
jgi:RND family efflux transporter MFP subunit